jgi:hypothetical protein
MSNQFAGSQSGQQIADCRLGGRPSSVLDVEDSLLGPVSDPGEGHPKRPVTVSDSLLHRTVFLTVFVIPGAMITALPV